MVTEEELEDENEFLDIREDVRLECAAHGPVLDVLIPRVKDGYSASIVGELFLFVIYFHE
jgi:hypothetical protein